MSGGHFEYRQDRIKEMALEVDILILRNAPAHRDGESLRPETIAKFTETRDLLLRVAAMVQRVDWLVSGDDGEDDFHERWEDEVPKKPINDDGENEKVEV